MKKLLGIIALGLLLSGCLETPKGNLPKINQDEIDIEAERQKRISYAKYIDQMSLVKNIGYKINSLNSDICNKIDYNSGLRVFNKNKLLVSQKVNIWIIFIESFRTYLK